MQQTIQKLNKATLAQDTGISHSRLRKFACGEIKSLTEDEVETIYQYLLTLAQKFKK